MTTKEEALERGRELYVEIFSDKFSDDVLEMLKEGHVLDNTIFAMYHDAVQEGFIEDITDVLPSIDGTPMYVVSAMRIRSLLCAALTVGMYHQKVTSTLDHMWERPFTSTDDKGEVDKNPESE